MFDTSPHSLLVVEDDPLIREFLCDQLICDGFEVRAADSVAAAKLALDQSAPDLVLTDITLGDGTGLELISQIRASDGITQAINPELPVMVLSGRGEELDRMRGFQRGCDDYVTKPFSYPELKLRIDALLRRSSSQPKSGRIRLGNLELDPSTREVKLAGEIVSLTGKEYALLLALAREPHRVFSKDELLRGVWGFQSHAITRTIDSHACRLRKKLGRRGDSFVVNVWGFGYRLIEGSVADHEPRTASQLGGVAA